MNKFGLTPPPSGIVSLVVRQNPMKHILFSMLFACILCCGAVARTNSQRVTNVEQRVSALEGRAKQFGGEGLALFLVGAFCALWAQNTGRNAWLWFFLGLFFSVITVIALLIKNSNDRADSPCGKKPFDLHDYRKL